jgi:hypothetical protein
VHRARVDIELNGLVLELKYEAENMMELSRIAGVDPLSFLVRLQRGDNLDKYEVGMRSCDPAVLVPLIIAGLAHRDEYAGVSDRDMRRRICSLLDAEVVKQKSSLMIVSAHLVAKILPVFSNAITPPGGDAKPNEEAGPSPLPETPAGSSDGMS